MAEVAGLALGAIGLAAVFGTCIDAFDTVQMARTQDQAYRILSTKLENQKVRFIIWGESLGLHGSDYDSRLDHPIRRDSVRRTMALVRDLFAEAEGLQARYGLRQETERSSASTTSQHLIDESAWKGFFRRVRTKVKKQPVKEQTQVERVRGGVMRWVIVDRNGFTTLVTDLRELIDDLDALTRFSDTRAIRRQRVSFEIESIGDTESLQMIRDAGEDDDDDAISIAASQRLQELEAGDARGLPWGSISLKHALAEKDVKPFQNRTMKRKKMKGLALLNPSSNNNALSPELVDSGYRLPSRSRSLDRMFPNARYADGMDSGEHLPLWQYENRSRRRKRVQVDHRYVEIGPQIAEGDDENEEDVTFHPPVDVSGLFVLDAAFASVPKIYDLAKSHETQKSLRQARSDGSLSKKFPGDGSLHQFHPSDVVKSAAHARDASHGTRSAPSSPAGEEEEEDWTKVADPAERRRIQNLIARRMYRKKVTRRLEDGAHYSSEQLAGRYRVSVKWPRVSGDVDYPQA